ncbi:MAG: hypothetical protein ACREN8_09290, partial [Candidatus Dormibacteraceae bacterium]
STQLFPYLTAHLDRLTDILSGSMAYKLRQRLIATAGATASLSGWIAWDKGDPSRSQQLYRIASDASYEVHERSLMAVCLGNMSYMPSSRGDARNAEKMLAQAMEHVTPTEYPRISAWLEARRAEELASLGDTAALPLLESSFSHFTTENPKGEVYFLSPARLDIFALNVHLHLGCHSDAIASAKRVMASVPATSPLRPIILADVATAYLKSGNFEQGTEIAAQAYQAVATTRSKWAFSRLDNLHQLLQARAPYDSRASELVAQFNTA